MYCRLKAVDQHLSVSHMLAAVRSLIVLTACLEQMQANAWQGAGSTSVQLWEVL